MALGSPCSVYHVVRAPSGSLPAVLSSGNLRQPPDAHVRSFAWLQVTASSLDASAIPSDRSSEQRRTDVAKLSKTIQFLIVSVGALVVVTAINLTVDAGAVLHDAVCPDHGWLA